mmetsp:Transcript_51782/g.166729  ORF Transcript_51782/g.166729 Transcript_51782/m.166729 type:complete len:91 (-) Transcript_51782:91-363(-)
MLVLHSTLNFLSRIPIRCTGVMRASHTVNLTSSDLQERRAQFKLHTSSALSSAPCGVLLFLLGYRRFLGWMQALHLKTQRSAPYCKLSSC